MKKGIQPAIALLALGLAACGGGGGGTHDNATAAPVAATDRRVLVSQYKPGTPVPLGVAQAQTASDYQFVTVPLAVTEGDATLLVPALALAQRALLFAAVAGSPRSDMSAQPGDPRHLAAGVAKRELQSLAGFAALPEWLQASALGGADDVAPTAWQATVLSVWDYSVGNLPAGFSASLRVLDSVDAGWAWPADAERFEGVFEFDGGARELRQMLRLRGRGWQLATTGFNAQGLVLDGGVQLIKLRPSQGSMQAFARSPALAEALVMVNQHLRAGPVLANSSMVLGDQSPALSDAHGLFDGQRVGSPENLPFTQMDGRGQYAELRRYGVGLSWDAGGLRLTGSQSLLFVGVGGSGNSSQSGGAGNTSTVDLPPFWLPPACPSAPVLRPELLLAVDAQFRLLWLARLPSQGGNPKPCL